LLERRRIFCAFLSKLRGDIEAISGQDFEAIWKIYASNHSTFLAEAERVRGDFGDRKVFDELLYAAAHVQYEAVKSAAEDYREPIVTPLKKLYEYINASEVRRF
jgi:hypothetical protein